MKDSFNVVLTIGGASTTLLMPDYLFKEDLADVKVFLRQVYKEREKNADAINRIESYLVKYKELYEKDAEMAKQIMDYGQPRGSTRRVCRESMKDYARIGQLSKYVEYLNNVKEKIENV